MVAVIPSSMEFGEKTTVCAHSAWSRRTGQNLSVSVLSSVTAIKPSAPEE